MWNHDQRLWNSFRRLLYQHSRWWNHNLWWHRMLGSNCIHHMLDKWMHYDWVLLSLWNFAALVGGSPTLVKDKIGRSAKSGSKGTIFFHPSELGCLLRGYFQHGEHPSVEHWVPLLDKHLGIEPKIPPTTICLTLTPNPDLGPQGSCFDSLAKFFRVHSSIGISRDLMAQTISRLMA